MSRLLVFGYGYVARCLGAALVREGWSVTGTRSDAGGAAATSAEGVTGVVFDGAAPSPGVKEALAGATHLLACIPPGAEGDPALRHHLADIVGAPALRWIGLLSTTGVYGDRGGAWVDESAPTRPGNPRTARREAAERAWATAAAAAAVPLQIFRLSGIYGPGRSPLDRIRSGTARRVTSPGTVFNRIHVDDIAGVVRAGMARPESTGAFNVSDALPAPPDDVLLHGAALLGVDPPPEVPLDEAGLSPLGRSFYTENKRVRSLRLEADLAYELRFPTYREGLAALVAE